VLDTMKINRELGWSAAVSLDDGVRLTVDYFRANLPHGA
jgi:nucleoside-diphosphate-sugar epimerase